MELADGATMNAPLHITDLHNHLVPGVDDGAATVEESIAALRQLYVEGVVTLVCTPHIVLPRLETEEAVTRELDRQRRAFDRLRDACAARTDVPQLALGQEIWAPDRATARRIARHPSLALGGTDYLLVEFGFDLVGDHVDVIETVQELGYRIVVAHPERYSFPARLDPADTMRQWRERGAHLQVNVGSLTGHYVSQRPESEPLAWMLVESGLAGLLGTDHHGPRRAGVSPRDARAALIERGFARAAERLMSVNPGRIARGQAELVYGSGEAHLTPADATLAS